VPVCPYLPVQALNMAVCIETDGFGWVWCHVALINHQGSSELASVQTEIVDCFTR